MNSGTQTKRPFELWLLIALMLFLGLGGLFGGILMLLDPSGALIQMANVLPLLPVHDFMPPGLFLLFVMGVKPLAPAYGLLARPDWRWVQRWFNWSGHHWAWFGTVVIGAVLGIWLLIQALYIGFIRPIQYVTAVNGALILLFALAPRVRKHCVSAH